MTQKPLYNGPWSCRHGQPCQRATPTHITSIFMLGRPCLGGPMQFTPLIVILATTPHTKPLVKTENILKFKTFEILLATYKSKKYFSKIVLYVEERRFKIITYKFKGKKKRVYHRWGCWNEHVVKLENIELKMSTFGSIRGRINRWKIKRNSFEIALTYPT